MDFIYNTITYLNDQSILWTAIAVFSIVIFVLIYLIRHPGSLAEIASYAVQPFFLSIDTNDASRAGISELKEKLDLLNEKIDSIRVEVEESAVKQDEENGSKVEAGENLNNRNAFDSLQHVRKIRGDDFQRILWGWDKPHSNISDIVHQLILMRLADSGRNKEEFSIEALSSMLSQAAENETRWGQKKRLDTVLSEQLASASSIRRAMLNLFILVNFILIASIIFKAEDVLSNKEIILGLYISFSTFIVYVYRSSNARALILMAGIEDSKRYHDADKYLQLIGRRGLNERDVEALKMLLINRMEREKNSEHPYELVLKGVSNSNILMKGGKVSAKDFKDKDLPK